VLRKFDDSKRLLDEAVRLHPDFGVAHDVVGDLLFAQGFVSAAVKAYEQALRLDPTNSSPLAKIEKAQELIKIAEKAGPQSDEAPAEARRMAVQFAPDYTRLWVDLSNVLRESDKSDEALQCAAKVLELAPDTAESHMLYAGVLGTLGRHDDAIASYEKTLKISPNKPGALCSMAHHLKTIGGQEEAIATYRNCIASKPDHAEAYWSLANLKTFQFNEAEIETMHSLLDDDDLPDLSRVQIHNALGLDRESRSEYETAFSHYQQCNSLRRNSETYDPVETETRNDRLISFFDTEFLQQHTDVGNEDASPIFVVGLPRSGSTLIEQILASHSMVDGTHELSDLTRIVQSLRRPGKKRLARTILSPPGSIVRVPPILSTKTRIISCTSACCALPCPTQR